MEKAIGRLKKGKTAREDELEDEVWNYAGEGLKKKMWKMYKMM